MRYLPHCACVILAGVVLVLSRPAMGLDIVVDGHARATLVVEAAEKPAPPPVKGKGKGGKKRAVPGHAVGDAMAADVLADWMRKISGAQVSIAASAPADGVAIYIGKAAIKAGLKLDAIQSPTHEGFRIVCDGKRILLAGQNDTATVKAACRLLEELGCRYFMDSPLGEVYPHLPTIAVKEMDVSDKPGLDMREIWGSSWSGSSLWKIWNGAGGLQLQTGHSWGRYVSQDLFATHPEYFALRNGQRKKGDWYCTSNPELRKIFAEGVLRAIAADGGIGASISPPDGIGYCECEKCRAQDDLKSIEPSSGRVCVTDRYVDFFNDVACRVREKYPEAKLSFYCYADYTQAPTRGLKLEPNLVAWIAPLRYCRLHEIGSPICPSRSQLKEMIDGWSAASHQIGYRAYNFQPAECLVPFSMMTMWAHDMPFLKERHAIGVNLESLDSWQIYGPHLYLSLRLAYDPSAPIEPLLDDYFDRFYGPITGRLMAVYWLEIDHAFNSLHAHAGSFFAVHRVYTPELMVRCQKLLDQATATAAVDPTYSARVAMAVEGFKNAGQYMQLREAIDGGHARDAASIYQTLLKRTEAQTAAGYSNHYTSGYLSRFIGKDIAALTAATAAPNSVAVVLPDRWRLAYDEQDKGRESGFAKAEFDDSSWKTVATFGDTLDGQGLPDRKTILWCRVNLDLPEVKARPSLFFMEVDGNATVFINGKESGASAKKRTSFTVDAVALHAGHNTIAVRVDHSAITELFLGGIIRPVYLIEQ